MKNPDRTLSEETIGQENGCGVKERRDGEYRRRILAAASRLFGTNGIDAVNMYQIAQEAGIGQGTLYRRYAHLGEIYSDLLHSDTERFLADMEADDFGEVSETEKEGLSSELDRLNEIITRLVLYVDDHVELLSAINNMYAGKSFLPHKRPITLRLHRLFASILERACKQGEAPDIDVTQTANILLAALAPEQYLHHRDHLGYSKERYLSGIRRIFIDGLRK
jgi:AcrR family transcriptional regulator